MIVRMSEASVLPDRIAEFTAALAELVATFPERFEGLVSHEVLTDSDDPTRIVYVSRWTSEQALVAFAGPNWQHDPVTFPQEELYVSAPLALRHFTVDSTH